VFSQINRIVSLYREGFKSMVVGRLLWKIILVKLILFAVLAKIFFPDYLKTNFTTDRDRAEHVLAALTAQPQIEEKNQILRRD
jgi:hypothetical protein